MLIVEVYHPLTAAWVSHCTWLITSTILNQDFLQNQTLPIGKFNVNPNSEILVYISGHVDEGAIASKKGIGLRCQVMAAVVVLVVEGVEKVVAAMVAVVAASEVEKVVVEVAAPVVVVTVEVSMAVEVVAVAAAATATAVVLVVAVEVVAVVLVAVVMVVAVSVEEQLSCW